MTSNGSRSIYKSGIEIKWDNLMQKKKKNGR